MQISVRSLGFGFGAIAASALMSGGASVAQPLTIDPRAIPAGYLFQYARYYTPYAIQAAVAYSPVNDLEAVRAAPPQADAGADPDVVYAAHNITSNATIESHARQAFRTWQYQFGSEGYLGCIDPNDTECKSALPGFFKFNFGAGPSFQVWAHTHYPHTAGDFCTEVSIAFRGTQGGVDWFSNFEPVTTPAVDDYYHQLRRNMDAIIRKIAALDCYKRARIKPQLVSVGHSLGGGLAQLAALAPRATGPRVSKVFAFDPSPVTGADLVDKQTLNVNKQGLTIDRIYQYGEVLAFLRPVAQQYPPASKACNPLVRTVHVDAFGGNAVQRHNMQELAEHFVDFSYDGNREFAYQPPQGNGCPVRYQNRPTDEDQNEVPVAGINTRLFANAFATGDDHNLKTAQAQTRAYGAREGISIARTTNSKFQRVQLVARKKMVHGANPAPTSVSWLGF